MRGSDLYDAADYYDWTSLGLDGDVAYYVNLARIKRGPVLELGCGTGRISLQIAKQGIEVVGVDRSHAMLARARKKAEEMELSGRVQWIEADITRFQLESSQQFPLIIIPYRTFLHLLKVEEQIATLKRVYDYLRPNGLFAMDLFVPDLVTMVEKDGRFDFRGSFPIPGTEHRVDVVDYVQYEHFYQQAYVTRYYERYDSKGVMVERLQKKFQFRYIYPTELIHLLQLSGFQVLHRYGSFRHTPFNQSSKELIIEARKRRCDENSL